MIPNQDIIYSVIDEVTGKDHQVYLDFEDDRIFFTAYCPASGAKISKQQLFELGSLLISLAESDIDTDSAKELLDGFGIPLSPFLKLPE